MNEEEKQRYKERYKEKKADGEMFFPDTIAKDAVVSLGIFVLLILLVILLGVPNEPPANPSDSTYIPRPEWYFLWAFQLLKYFPGQIEGLAIVGLGLVIFLGLFGLPFFDRGPKRNWRNRPIATIVMLLIVAGMVFLTIQAVVTTPPQAEAVNVGGDLAARIEAGGKLYGEYCAECHGEDGEGAEIKNQPGEFTNPLNDEDFLITHTRDTLFNVIDYGWQSLGMSPFGLKYGGALDGSGHQGHRGLHAGVVRPAGRGRAAVRPMRRRWRRSPTRASRRMSSRSWPSVARAATAHAKRAATASPTTTQS